jgi:predicted dehydrogenase
MSDQPVKVGVIGVGSLGQWHARIYSELPGADLVGVYDVDESQAGRIARKYGTRVFDSLDAFAGAIDAASVVVPTHLHHEVALSLIEKNVHLLIEKPIAATTQEAEELVRRAGEKGVLIQVGHVERFNPAFNYLEGIVNNPRFIEAHRLAPYPKPREGLHPRGTEVSVVLDLMIHDLEVLLHLVRSPVKAFHAVGVPVLSRSEDIANVRLQFANGCVANVTASRISPEPMRKIRVFVEDAYISLDYQKQAGEIYRKNQSKILREKVPIQKGEPLANELNSFVNSVARQDQPVVTGEHAARALQLAVAITQSISEGAS